jgi:hypothetical protein
MKELNIGVCVVAAIALGGVALAQEKTGAQAARASAAAPANVRTNTAGAKGARGAHIIGYLERRDQTITIKSGPRGPVYSVAGKDGKVLFEDLTAEQLKAQAPELHEFLKSSVATGSGKGGVILDASVRAERFQLNGLGARR